LGQPNLAIYFNFGARSNVSNIIGCIAGFVNVGGLLGVPLIAWSADKFGRRKAMMFCCMCAWWALPKFFSDQFTLRFMALGAALAAGSRNLAMLIAGRFFTGFGGWAMMLVAVLYAAEIAPASQVISIGVGRCCSYKWNQRGLLGGMIGFGLSTGYIVSYLHACWFYSNTWSRSALVGRDTAFSSMRILSIGVFR
jgi:MFS family permease